MNKHQLFTKLILLVSFTITSIFSFAQVKQEWVARYDGPGITDDVVYDVTTDASGNVYVTGRSRTGDLSSNVATVKYNATGNLLWSKSKSFSGTGDSYGAAIVTDPSGNVYVTGTTSNEMEDYYITIKYDNAGNELWAEKFLGTNTEGSGRARDVAIDVAGNVYVTGTTVTIKYDADGNQLWVNADVNGNKIMTDEANNIYVAGMNVTKLSADGVAIWSATYGSEGAIDIALDGNDNVYVTGPSGTIKYNTSGQKLWTKISPGLEASAITLDNGANVYITGTIQGTTTGKNIRTVKYDTNGKWLWSQWYNGSANMDDLASDIAIDAQGDVYVTGKSQTAQVTSVTQNASTVTIKYGADGTQQWVSNIATTVETFLASNFPQIARSTDGNIYVATTQNKNAIDADFLVINYNSSGIQDWTALYNSTGTSFETVADMTTDADGNIYVTGQSWSFGLDQEHADFATVKYDAAGNQLWVQRFTGADADIFSSNDEANAIAVDGNGNVYVTGFTTKINNNNDGSTTRIEYITTIKYDANGNEIWVKYFNPGVANDIAVDNDGNVYITGYNTVIDNNTSQIISGGMVTVKYDTNGNELWSKTITEPQISFSGGQALQIDASGKVYVTGTLMGEGNQRLLITVNYDTDGNQIWMNQYNNANGSSLGIDAAGNVFVLGFDDTALQIVTIKYSSTGNELWINRHDANNTYSFNQKHIAVDVMGNAIITAPFNQDYLVIKYLSDGTLAWENVYDGLSASIDYPGSITTDNTGNIYVAGISFISDASNSAASFVTFKLDKDGNKIWSQPYGPFTERYSPIIVVLDYQNNVIVSGTAHSDFTTIKYVQDQSNASPLTVNAGKDKTIYLGYGYNCKTITAEVSGGAEPYTYSWTNDNSNSSEARVCPTTTTTYTLTVTDANGTQASDEVTINVIDVRCGNKNDKIMVCHKGKTLCIGKESVDEHLSHGDKLGICNVDADVTRSSEGVNFEQNNNGVPFKASNTPNPFINSTTIQYSLPYDGKVLLTVYDALGREVAKLVNAEQKAGSHNTRFTREKQKGMYYYRITLTTENKTYTQTGKMISN